MLNINSNCSRVDAVKAAANLLDLQSTAANSSATAPTGSATAAARKVKSDLQGVTSQVKTGNAQAAEIALAAAKKDVQAADVSPAKSDAGRSPWTLDVHA